MSDATDVAIPDGVGRSARDPDSWDFSIKRLQTSPPLMSEDQSADTPLEQHLTLNQARNDMNPNLTPLRTRTDRQLVFTSSQAARYVGVSLATIRRWSDAGHLTCYRTPGGQRRFSRDQLDDFIASLRGDAGGSDDLMPPAAAA